MNSDPAVTDAVRRRTVTDLLSEVAHFYTNLSFPLSTFLKYSFLGSPPFAIKTKGHKNIPYTNDPKFFLLNDGGK